MKHVVDTVYVYNYNDPDCDEDYVGLSIRVDGHLVAVFGDWYHDKGDEKAEGYCMAIEGMLGRGNVDFKVSSINATEDRPDAMPILKDELKTLKEVLCLNSPQNSPCSCSASMVPVGKPQPPVATPSVRC